MREDKVSARGKDAPRQRVQDPEGEREGGGVEAGFLAPSQARGVRMTLCSLQLKEGSWANPGSGTYALYRKYFE